ncbi:ADP-ribosyltransferase [Streptomyces cinereoruber]|uniref:ADP-ribosyltransferase n=1 Tax=Streptomyces cinereoruber TaxID=67260 RepID=UPI00363BC3EC
MADRNRQLDQAEAEFARVLADVLTETADEFAAAVADASELVAARFSVGRIARMWSNRTRRLVRQLLGTADTAAVAAAEDVDAELPDGWDDLPARYDDGTLPEPMRRYVETTEHLLRAVGDRLADVARAELAAGIAAGEDVDQLRDRLHAEFTRQGTQLGPGREQRIAQTEASRAWNTATLEAARAATGPDRPIVKQWVTRHDSRVRTAHSRVDGQLRPLDEPFTVEGVAMQTPGDPTAPAGLVINCRCRLAVAPELRAATLETQASLGAGFSEQRRSGMRTADIETRQFHGTRGRPSYKKYHPSGRNSVGNGRTRHENGGLLGSNRYSEEEHSAVLESYTIDGYDDMNRWLRHRGEPDYVTEEQVQRQISVLADLINAQEPTTSELTLYRGMRGQFLELNEGDEFHDKGFVSTSSSEDVPRRRVTKKGGMYFTITVPKGAQVLDVASVGARAAEDEVILPPGTQYRVRSVAPHDDPDRPGVHYQLEVINV